MKKIALLVLSLAANGVLALEMSNYYSDNMMFQRNKPIPVIGKTAANGEVNAVFNGEERVASADENGGFKIIFPAREASFEPGKLVVQDVNDSRTFSNILIGDIFVASGQSNMEFGFQSCSTYEQDKADFARNSNIRFLYVPRDLAHTPRKKLNEGGWFLLADHAKYVSAIGYYFAKDLQQSMNVPIGMIDASLGASNIEGWMTPLDTQTVARELMEKKIAQTQEKFPAAIPMVQKWNQKSFDLFAVEIAEAKKMHGANVDTSAWRNITIPGSLIHQGFFGQGQWLFRKTFHVPADFITKEMRLILGAVNEYDESYLNGTLVGSMKDDQIQSWSTLRDYMIPENVVVPGENTLSIALFYHLFLGGIDPETEFIGMINNRGEKLSLAGNDWKTKNVYVLDYGKVPWRAEFPGETKNRNYPAALYNAMISPFVNHPIAGVIWYQGENNAEEPDHYAIMAPELIQNWRNAWNDENLPFFITQLSSWVYAGWSRPAVMPDFQKQDVNSFGYWPKIREIQADCTKLPHVGMAVTIDIGDPFDIHPANKKTVAERLAREAKRMIYHQNILSRGPVFQSMKINGNQAVLSFSNIGGGLVSSDGRPLTNFIIAGKDHIYHRADAVIDHNQVIVSSAKVKNPVSVGYCYSQYPFEVNFYNKDGLPAEPFKTK